MEAKDFVVGERYRVLGKLYGHGFEIGSQVTLKEIDAENSPSGLCEKNGLGRWVALAQLAPVEPDYPILATIERKDLPDDVKAKAKAAAIRIIETGEARCINGSKLASTLEGFCTWSATKEGRGFWDMICSAPDKPIAAAVELPAEDVTAKIKSLTIDDFTDTPPVKSITAPEGSIVMIGARPVLTYAAIPHDTVTAEETTKAAWVEEERWRYESR